MNLQTTRQGTWQGPQENPILRVGCKVPLNMALLLAEGNVSEVRLSLLSLLFALAKVHSVNRSCSTSICTLWHCYVYSYKCIFSGDRVTYSLVDHYSILGNFVSFSVLVVIGIFTFLLSQCVCACVVWWVLPGAWTFMNTNEIQNINFLCQEVIDGKVTTDFSSVITRTLHVPL